jgi:hypothetical protein
VPQISSPWQAWHEEASMWHDSLKKRRNNSARNVLFVILSIDNKLMQVVS